MKVTISEFTNPNGAYVWQVLHRGMPITQEFTSGFWQALDAARSFGAVEITRYYGDTGVSEPFTEASA